MARYRARPTEIDAERFTADGPIPAGVFSGRCGCGMNDVHHVHTLHGPAAIKLGDYVIPESTCPGLFYPCDAKAFAQRWEPI